MALTDTAVRKAKSKEKAYTLSDIDGLSLYIDPKGYKNWHFRFSWLGAFHSAPILKSVLKKPVSVGMKPGH